MRFKKLLAAMLAAVQVAGLVPTAFAAGEELGAFRRNVPSVDGSVREIDAVGPVDRIPGDMELPNADPVYSPSAEYMNSVYYTNLLNVKLTGRYHEDLVNIALSQVGYHEGNSTADHGGGNTSGTGNYTEYGKWRGVNGQPWCAIFIGWCAVQAKIPQDTIDNQGRFANANSMGVEWKDSSSYTPQKGDLFIWDTSNDPSSPSSGDHIGIVYAVDSEYVYTVEGNSDNQVYKRRYSLNNSGIGGYGVYVEAGHPVQEGRYPYPGLLDYTDLDSSFDVVASDKILPQYRDYVLNALKHHIESDEEGYRVAKNLMHAYKENEDGNVVFFFDGCSINLDEASITFSGYSKNGQRYNTSAVCIVVQKNDSGRAEIVYATANASTMADNVRRETLNSPKNSVPIVKDGVYNITSVNHPSQSTPDYAALNINSASVIRCSSKGNTGTLTSNENTASGINIHARGYADSALTNDTYSSTGCFNIGLGYNEDNYADYNAFMEAVSGVTNARHNYNTPEGHVWGIVIVDRSNYKSSLETIYGDDNCSSGWTKEQIVQAITEGSEQWHEGIIERGSDLIPLAERVVGEHRYTLYQGNLPWWKAKAYCADRGGYLMTVTSEEEQEILRELNEEDQRIWLGGFKENDTWRWVTDEPFEYNAWNSGQPDNGNGMEEELCLGTWDWTDSAWNDFPPYAYDICGFVMETGEFFDTSEFVVPEYTPVRSKSFNGHTYSVYLLHMPWSTAKEYCRMHDGYLMTVTSEREQEFLCEINEENTKLWLGGYRENGNSEWKWVTGEPFLYTRWNDGEPNNGDGWEEEPCIGTWEYSESRWCDFPPCAYDIVGFVMETGTEWSGPAITSQPSDAVVGLSETAQFAVAVSGGAEPYTYQWEYQTRGSDTWRQVRSDEGKKEVYSLVVLQRHDGYRYRCIVTDANGMSVISDTAVLRVGTPLTVAVQPTDQTVTAGTKVSFAVTASGGKEPYEYKWQYRKTETGAWTPVSSSSGKMQAYTLTAEARHNGFRYQCIITDATGQTVTSGIAALTVETPPIEVTEEPMDATIVEGKAATFEVRVSGGIKPYKYQWQYRKPGTESWTNVSASSGKSARYTLNVELRHNGYQYRCAITDAGDDTVMTKVFLLTVVKQGTLVITSHPEAQNVSLGGTACFSVTVEGGTAPYTYQWQYLKPGASAWAKVKADSGKTAEYSLKVEARHNGYVYRCEISDAAGKSIISNNAVLTVGSGQNKTTALVAMIPDYGADFPVLDLTEEEEALWDLGELNEADLPVLPAESSFIGYAGAEETSEAFVLTADFSDESAAFWGDLSAYDFDAAVDGYEAE